MIYIYNTYLLHTWKLNSNSRKKKKNPLHMLHNQYTVITYTIHVIRTIEAFYQTPCVHPSNIIIFNTIASSSPPLHLRTTTKQKIKQKNQSWTQLTNRKSKHNKQIKQKMRSNLTKKKKKRKRKKKKRRCSPCQDLVGKV